MPLDAMFLCALTKELQTLKNSKIDKVQQPGRDILILSLRGASGNRKLIISAGSGNARVHLTNQSYENPEKPPAFCMLMRKHLVGARISAVTQPESERLLIFELDALSEMGEMLHPKLIVEMMGRNPNIILTDGGGIITGCLRQVGFESEGKRQIMPGLFYRLPPVQPKLPFTQASREIFSRLWLTADPQLEADRWVLDTFSGISPLICRELCFRVFGDASPRIMRLDETQREKFPSMLDTFRDRLEHDASPWMLSENGTLKDFSFTPIAQYSGRMDLSEYGGFSELLDAFYAERERSELMRRRSQPLMKTVKSSRDKLARKLAVQEEELSHAANREVPRRYGELITANMYRIRKGDMSLRAVDYNDEDQPELVIELNPLKTPQQNAARYFREYSKAKNAEEHLSALIADGRVQLEYLESVLHEIGMVESESDLSEIRYELTESGFLRKPREKQKEKNRVSSPYRFVSEQGFEIFAGRNNRQNDILTFKTAHRNDLWLHAQKFHGSHVIIACNGMEPDSQTIAEAASIAAYYSQAQGGGKVPVDFTLVRHVKKIKGAMPGMVTYTDYKTIIVEPAFL